MNALRRKEIEKAWSLLTQAKEILETARDEEREYFDNMPEALQAGERGQKADEDANTLEEACDSIADVVSNLQSIC